MDLLDEDNVSDLEYDEVQLTAAQVIQDMQEAWMNEKFAPELLPGRSDFVGCLLDQIKFMEQNLRALEIVDFPRSIHQLEIDRLRYLVTSYLRTRLNKIELYCPQILKEERERILKQEDPYLSEAERQFADKYYEAWTDHYDEVISFCPTITRFIDNWKGEMDPVNINRFVFFKSKTEVMGIAIEDSGIGDEGQDLVDLNVGSRMITSYKSVANLLKTDQGHLM